MQALARTDAADGTPPRRVSSAPLMIILAIAVLGAAMILFAYWPGIMIDDARWQYQQALDNAYEDWHPPLMAWVWHHMIGLAPGPAPMFALQVLLYWVGIAFIAASAQKRRHPRLALALAAAGFLPAIQALMGSVTKDALMDSVLIIACAMLLWRPLVRTAPARTGLALGSIAALFVAAALRLNGVFACLPLALVALPESFTRTGPRLLLSGVAEATAFLAIGPAISALVQAEDMDVQLSLIIFDLGGITERTGVSQFPDLHVADPVAVNHRCYDPYGWDSYSDWATRPCPLGFDPMQALVDGGDFDARRWWVHAVASHPLAYAEHRFTHFNLSSWFLVPSGPAFTASSQSVPNPWGFEVRNNELLMSITRVTNGAATTPIGWPIFWISLALATFVAGLMTHANREPLAIAASAFAYGGGYLLVGVATGIRYYMWTFSGALLAAILIGAEIWRRRDDLKRKALLIPASIVALPTLAAIASRIFAT